MSIEQVTELIYIGGYGRSGSTLLETLLATRPYVLACGEVVSALRKAKERPCTCGKSRYACEVWGAFYKKPGTLRGLDHAALVSALLDHASHRYGFLVDSSKTAWDSLATPFKLQRKLGRKFHLIHVVRDPHGVCWSKVSGAWRRRAALKSTTLRHVKTSLGWWSANLSCELFRRAYPEQYQRVRYEDLARSSPEILDRLFTKLPPAQDMHERDQSTSNRHQLFGNQWRHREVSPSSIREDARWRAEMPAGQKALVSALTWPLRLRYGY